MFIEDLTIHFRGNGFHLLEDLTMHFRGNAFPLLEPDSLVLIEVYLEISSEIFTMPSCGRSGRA